jgi:hypothetical protein
MRTTYMLRARRLVEKHLAPPLHAGMLGAMSGWRTSAKAKIRPQADRQFSHR